MDVEFSELTYSIPDIIRREKKELLHSVSGIFRSGQLSAILGPSGAGKSSLLNVISGYKSEGVDGCLKTNGELRNESHFHKSSCYITQEDLLQPYLSVLEVMTFAANFKLSPNLSKEKHLAIVEDVLKDLRLYEQRFTRTEYLSGGQKKRLSIALELINNPPIFFLDEPTSGLDNVSTSHCLRILQKLARQGRTIVCTIHQPSASMFQMFDHVYILAMGRCVYQGAPNALVSFLSNIGLECPKHYNPADYIIELTDGSFNENINLLSKMIENGKLNRTALAIESLPDAMSNSKINSSTQKIYESTTFSDSKLQTYSSQITIEYPTTYWLQFYVLLQRMLKQLFRNRIALRVQFIHYFLCGLTIGIMFYKQADNGMEIFGHLKYCFGVIVFFAYTQLMIPILLLPFEVKLMKKEHFNRWYGLAPYYAALTVARLPVQIAFNMLFICLVYFMAGYPVELHRFGIFALVANLMSFISEGLGLAVGSRFNVLNGCAVGPSILAPSFGLAMYGFDFAQQIPLAMQILMKLSFMRCGAVALVVVVFGYGRKQLDCGDVYCHFDKPEVLLRYLDFQETSVWSEIGFMLITLVLFRTICYLNLKRRVSC